MRMFLCPGSKAPSVEGRRCTKLSQRNIPELGRRLEIRAEEG